MSGQVLRRRRGTGRSTRRWGRGTGRRRRRSVLAVALVLVGAVVFLLTRAVQVSVSPECSFAGPGGYRLGPDQAQEASVIAAAGARLGLPDHAVTIALAAALQESKLRNLDYGDRDSVGLFQQRPSEGWGSRAQILDPNYAATAFYQHLEAVPGWPLLPVAVAAQDVQHSADGSAYGSWAGEARILAVDLTGEVPAGVSCQLSSFQGPVPEAGALQTAGESELGVSPYEADPGPRTGWRIAGWMVAHAYAYHLSAVSYADRRWSAASGHWTSTTSADPATVTSS